MAAALAPERWQRLRPLLDQALDLDASARERFLRELSTESDELRVDLERLIARHQATAGLSRPAAEIAGAAIEVTDVGGEKPAPFIGRRIGPYELTRLLGAGGMGAVYEGQRVDGGFRQTVAIKLVGGIHPGLTARFARERQILAELRHPHIAQLLDGGETSDGMPYFALEYIDGEPITEYANAIGADVDARLRLLIEVAEALAYAHRRNVIHRDIKPTNILVSADGHVKLLDFGIAKLIKGDSGPTLTQQRMGPMTPEYAAPEQFRGGDLSAATDIYQFGVLLFRLLAGRLPYRASSEDGLAWARAVSEQEPLSLTSALRDARRAAAAGTPSGEVTLRRFALRRGADLDAIVRRCLAKEPAARYPSMDALIADLQQYLSPGAPRRRSWRAGMLGVACAVAAIAAGAWYAWGWWPDARGAVAAAGSGEWTSEPALVAFGLRPENLYTEQPGTAGLIRQALLTEGRGDAPAALALLASAHRSDRRSPVPALLSSYWVSALGSDQTLLYWREEARTRLAGIDDPYLDLLKEFFERDVDGSVEDSLRYAAAILEMRPDAWFLRLARAHALSRRNLREAAVRELQAIDVTRLGHRKLVDAIADRGSFGDLAGAWAQFNKLEGSAEDPDLTALRARLTYSSGDLVAARDLYLQAVAQAQAAARFDIEARGLLWAGTFTAALGERERAEPLLRKARTRLAERSQFHYAADASLALAQLAALRNDTVTVQAEIDSARTLLANIRDTQHNSLQQLFAARLTGAALTLPESLGDADEGGMYALMQARVALQGGDPDGARAALERAREAGVGDGVLVEEAALLGRELGAPGFELRPIDPPFGPYARYAARLALGAGTTIAPPPTALPSR